MLAAMKAAKPQYNAAGVLNEVIWKHCDKETRVAP